MKLRADHRCDALVHERMGGALIVLQIDPAGGPAVLRTQELFPDQAGHIAEFWRRLVKRSTNLLGGNTNRQLEAGNHSNQVFHGTIDSERMVFCEWN